MVINQHNGAGGDSAHFGNGTSTPMRRPTTTGRIDYSKATNREAAYVGFANIPNQVFRRAIKQGFDFNLMVVGQSGLGKSTFINSLFLCELANPSNVTRIYPPTVHVESKTVRLIENGVQLNLTHIDTPGFGDSIDNNKCWEPIVDFIDRKYYDFFNEETKLERKDIIMDRRVHLCLYFIAPTGHGLRQLDVEFMKRLHDRVNVIPVIAKADTLTADELTRFKKQILKEINDNQIKVYRFPDADNEDERKELQPYKDRVPFAVVGSNMVKEGEGGRRVRYREYAWGTVEVENMKHNDFLALREMIISTNLIDLIDVTRNVHYENFRVRQLGGGNKTTVDRDPFTMIEHQRRLKEQELADKKVQMEKVFDEKVSERERKMTDRMTMLDQKEKENAKRLEERRVQIENLRVELAELRKQNPQIASTESRTNLHSSSSSSHTNENSPPDKTAKKKTGTLTFFRKHDE